MSVRPPARPAMATLLWCMLFFVPWKLYAAGQITSTPDNAGDKDADHLAIHSDALALEVVRSTGVTASLRPFRDPNFDFVPHDLLAKRSADTFYHLGDLDLRVRREGRSEWRPLSTAFRRKPATLLKGSDDELRLDLSRSLPEDAGIRLVRSWKRVDDDLRLEFRLTNTGDNSLEIGGLGIAIVLNNILTGRTLGQAYQRCSFYDPYIGMQAGYVQDVPLKGSGPVLLAAPLERSPLEGWKPILDDVDPQTGLGKIENDPTRRSVTFEGSFDWMIHTKAYADTEWKGVKEWNPPTSEVLQAGQTAVFGLRFFVAPAVNSIESTLLSHGRPVAIGVPGYILPQDMDGRLFVKYKRHVRSVHSEPAGAVTIKDDGILPSGFHAYTLRGVRWGNARIEITYEDGLVQPIEYRTIKPEREAVAALGRFLTHEQWYTDRSDPFGRAPSVISYDNQAHQYVLQDYRAWIAGLSDEAGAGSYLAVAMKELIQPKPDEVAKLEEFVDKVLWGHIQINEGPHKYGVRKSLFYFDPEKMATVHYDKDVISHPTWRRSEADRLDRTYNYPHVVSTYWALYRIARNTNGIVTHHPWQWYLNQAYQTTMAMKVEAGLFDKYGLMEGTVFTYLLDDLRSEGCSQQAETLEGYMRQRASVWEKETYPFGSEMPWDSTGQEEVYAWARRFGLDQKAEITLNAVLGYTPTIPNWGYNGSARRYWDFTTAGKINRLERMLHHYGSGLNAIPLLAEYRDHPDNLYLLRVGYGGTMGPLSNIDQSGFASVAFHSFPDLMAFDPYSGDYGSNFFGHAVNTGTYVTDDKDLGWLCFGGNLRKNGQVITVDVLDSARKRIFVAPLKLWITADAGSIESVEVNMQTQSVRLHLAPETPAQNRARFQVTGTAGAQSSQWHVFSASRDREQRYTVPIREGNATVLITRTGTKKGPT